MSNALADRVSISIHVYGADIGAVKRHVFDADTGAMKDFVSGYSEPYLMARHGRKRRMTGMGKSSTGKGNE